MTQAEIDNDQPWSIIGVCDYIAVPIPVQTALRTEGIDSPEKIDFALYTHALACASTASRSSEGGFPYHQINPPARSAPGVVTALLVAVYTLSKSAPSLSYQMDTGECLFKAKDGAITTEPSLTGLAPNSRERVRPVC